MPNLTHGVDHLELSGLEASEGSSESSVEMGNDDDSDKDERVIQRHREWMRKSRRELLQEALDILAGNDFNFYLAWLSFVLSWAAVLFGIFQPFDDMDGAYRMFILLICLFLFNQAFFIVKSLRDREITSLIDHNGRVRPLYHFLQGNPPGKTSFDRVVLYLSLLAVIAATIYGLIGMGHVEPDEDGGLADEDIECPVLAFAGKCAGDAWMEQNCAMSCSNPGGVTGEMTRGYTRMYMGLSILFMVSSAMNLASTLRDKFEAKVWFREMEDRHVMSKFVEIATHNILDALNKHQNMFIGVYALICMASLGIMIFAMMTFRFGGDKEKGIGLMSAAMFMALMASWNLARVLDDNLGKLDPTVYFFFLVSCIMVGCGVIIPHFHHTMERILFLLGIVIVMDATFHVAKQFHRGERVTKLTKYIKRKFFFEYTSTHSTKHGGEDHGGGHSSGPPKQKKSTTATLKLHPTAK